MSRCREKGGFLLRYIRNLLGLLPAEGLEVCSAAVKQNAQAFRFTRYQTEEMCLRAVRAEYSNLDCVMDQNWRIVYSAAERHCESLVITSMTGSVEILFYRWPAHTTF